MDENELENYLYQESLRIEPRNCKQPAKYVSLIVQNF